MKIKYGQGTTKYGPGIDIRLSSDEVAIAIMAYLVSKQTFVSGPQTIFVNGERIRGARIYVDPSGRVIRKGKVYSGRGPKNQR